MKHIRNTIKEIVEQLNKNGFNGTRVSARLELSEEPEDDQTVDEAAKFHRDYAIFVVDCQHEDLASMSSQSRYTICEFDSESFWQDLVEMVEKAFEGEDVKVVLHLPAKEVEVYRKNSEVVQS